MSSFTSSQTFSGRRFLAVCASSVLVASLETSRIPLHKVLSAAPFISSIQVAVGPEGDFSANEYAQMRSAKFKPVRLGANVLRAQTAAAYILSVVDQISQK